MKLYVYQTPDGLIADFRPYLDGFDHAHDDHRALSAGDQRQEKTRNLEHPVHGYPLAGQLRFVGAAEIAWQPVMRFPLVWEQGYEPVAWGAPASAADS